MTGAVAAGLLAALATSLTFPGRRRCDAGPVPVAASADDRGLVIRFRFLWAVLAGIGAATFVGGGWGTGVGAGAAVMVWVVVGRSEPPAVRRRREAVQRELPHLVDLYAAALTAGGSPTQSLDLVCGALRGPAADELRVAQGRLELGVPPGQVWADLAGHPHLAPLGRAMARAHASGASVVEAMHRLADDLAQSARSDVEDRARAVGVKAAMPLGLCLLPAFLLLGIVPLVAGALTALRL